MSKIKVSVRDLKKLIIRASLGDSLTESDMSHIKHKDQCDGAKEKRQTSKMLSAREPRKPIIEAVSQLLAKRPDSAFVKSLHEQVIDQKQDLSKKQKDVVIKMLKSFDLSDLAKEIS